MLVNIRSLGIAFLGFALAFLSWPTCAVAQGLSLKEPKEEIQKLLNLPSDIPIHIRFQIVQLSRMALGDAEFRKTVKEVLKENGLTEVQALQGKVSQVREQYQALRKTFGGTIPKPPSIRDITLPSPSNQFELDVFAPINATVQQLPTPNPTRIRLEAITRSVVSRATITMLRADLGARQKEAFAKLKIDESKDPLKDLKPYLREAVIKNPEFTNLKAEAQTHLGGLLQAAVKHNLQPIQEDLKELQARTKEQTETAIKTLNWVAEKQNLLAQTEQKLVDLQNKSMNDLQGLKEMVEGIDINKWEKLPTDQKKLDGVAQKLVTKEAGLTLLKVALYGPLLSNSTVQQIEAGYVRISSTIDAAKKMRDKFSALVKTQADLKGTLNSYASTGADILELAKEIPGIDKEAIRRGQDAFSQVSAGINLAGQLASGNYVAAVGSIGGLLGGGNPLGGGSGPDVQLVSMLTVIQAKLDTVLDNQKKMMASLDQLHNKIDLLTEMVQKNHVEVMAKIDAVHEDLLQNREILIKLIQMQIETCPLFLRIDDPTAYGKQEGYQLSYEEKANFFKDEDRRAQYGQCKEGMFKLLSDGNTLNPLFQLKLNPNDHEVSMTGQEKEKLTDLVKFHEKRFAPLATYAMNGSLSSSPKCMIQQDRVVAELLHPAPTIRELQKKCTTIPLANHARRETDWFPMLLNVELTTKVAETAVGLSPYYLLSDDAFDQKTLIPQSELSDSRKYQNVGIRAAKALEVLEPSRTLLNTAVAQQAILSGDLLLPYLYAHLDEPSIKQLIEEQWKYNNQRLAKNLLMYYLHQQLSDPTKQVTYAGLWLLLSADPANGVNILNKTIQPKNNTFLFEQGSDTKTWVAVLTPNVKVSLPTSEQFNSGQLEYSPELHKLDQVRNHVVSEIASIRLRGQLSADQLKDLALLSLLN